MAGEGKPQVSESILRMLGFDGDIDDFRKFEKELNEEPEEELDGSSLSESEIDKMLPGLSLLWDELRRKDLTREGSELLEEVGLRLGLYFIDQGGFVSESPSHVETGFRYLLISKALEKTGGESGWSKTLKFLGEALISLQVEEPLEEKLKLVKNAFTVVGQRGSGKGTVLKMMAEYGLNIAPSSKVLRQFLRSELFRDATTPELVEMGGELKEIFGYDVFIKWTLLQMLATDEIFWEKIAIDGLRTEQELKIFRDTFGERAVVIAVTRPSELTDEEMWEIIRERQAGSGKKEYNSFQEFQETQIIERDRIEALVAQADIVIENNGTLEELEAKVKEMMTN